MTHPNPVTAEQLAGSTGRDPAEFTEALAGIDQDALYDQHRETLVASVWNEEDPINGVPAAEVLQSVQRPTGGAIVLVGGTDGSTMILQPFDPGQPGMVGIDPADAQAVADKMADDVASERARSDAMAKLPAGLLNPAAPAPETPAPSVDLGPIQEQLAAQDELLNWLLGYVTTGEAPE